MFKQQFIFSIIALILGVFLYAEEQPDFLKKVDMKYKYRIIEHDTQNIQYNVFDCNSYISVENHLMIKPPAIFRLYYFEDGVYKKIIEKNLNETESTQYIARLRRIIENKTYQGKALEPDKVCKKSLKNLYQQLLSFKSDENFHIVGFMENGEFYWWLAKIDSLQKIVNIEINTKIAIGDLRMLGLEYISTKGKENEYTKSTRKFIEEVLTKE